MKAAEVLEIMEAVDVTEAAAVVILEVVDTGTATTPTLDPSIIREETNFLQTPRISTICTGTQWGNLSSTQPRRNTVLQ